MHKGRLHKYANSKKSRSRHRYRQTTNQIVSMNSEPDEENIIAADTKGLTPEQKAKLHDYIYYLKHNERPRRQLTATNDIEEERRRFNSVLEEKWRNHQTEIQKRNLASGLDYEFDERKTPSPSPSPSPSPRPIPSPSPSPTESSKSISSNNIFLDSLLLPPNIHDKTPPIGGGKSRRVFRRKMTSRRRQRRSTRSKHKH